MQFKKRTPTLTPQMSGTVELEEEEYKAKKAELRNAKIELQMRSPQPGSAFFLCVCVCVGMCILMVSEMSICFLYKIFLRMHKRRKHKWRKKKSFIFLKFSVLWETNGT